MIFNTLLATENHPPHQLSRIWWLFFVDSGLMFYTAQTASAFTVKLFLSRLPFKENSMNIAIEPLLALVVGILILLVPRFLNYFVAVYLIVVGVLGLMGHSIKWEIALKESLNKFLERLPSTSSGRTITGWFRFVASPSAMLRRVLSNHGRNQPVQSFLKGKATLFT